MVASDPVTAGQGQDNDRDDTEVISYYNVLPPSMAANPSSSFSRRNYLNIQDCGDCQPTPSAPFLGVVGGPGQRFGGQLLIDARFSVNAEILIAASIVSSSALRRVASTFEELNGHWVKSAVAEFGESPAPSFCCALYPGVSSSLSRWE